MDDKHTKNKIPLSVTNNRRVVEMLIKRPNSIVPLLDDECKFPKVIYFILYKLYITLFLGF